MSSVSSSTPRSLLQRAALTVGTALVAWAERRSQAAEQVRRHRRERALRLGAQQSAAEQRREETLTRRLQDPRPF